MIATMTTPFGSVKWRFLSDEAPQTSAYFIEFIRQKVLDNSSIFRIVSSENNTSNPDHPIHVIQAGLWQDDPQAQAVAPVRHEPTSETGLRHKRGTLSAARFKPGETYGSFFICMRDEPSLDEGGLRHPDGYGFAAFGMIEDGWDVLDRIFAELTPEEFLENPIKINHITLSDG